MDFTDDIGAPLLDAADIADLAAGANLPPREDVIALCEDLLARARSGDLRGLAVGMGIRGGATASTFTVGDSTIAELVCGCERAKLRLLTEL